MSDSHNRAKSGKNMQHMNLYYIFSGIHIMGSDSTLVIARA
jgi:hypothetical protein